MYKRQVAFSTASLPNHSLAEALREGSRMGFTGVELSAFEGVRHSAGEVPGLWFDRTPPGTRQEMRALVCAFDVLSTHAPFFHVSLFTHNPDVRTLALRQVKTAIDASAYLGGKMCTVHVNARPFMHVREFWHEVVDTLAGLGDYAARCGVTVAVETGYPDTVADFCELIADVNHEHVGACIDTGHLRSYVAHDLWGTAQGVEALNDKLVEMAETLGSKIISLHLHDVDGRDFRDHRQCGRGIVDFPRLMTVLERIAFSGPMFIELEEPASRTALASSKAFMEKILD